MATANVNQSCTSVIETLLNLVADLEQISKVADSKQREESLTEISKTYDLNIDELKRIDFDS